MNEVIKHTEQIRQLCVSNKVKSLFAFGSAIRDDFNATSDIDLVVEIEANDPLFYSESYFNLKFELEQLFRRKVDLLEYNTIQNTYFKSQIDETKVLIYG